MKLSIIIPAYNAGHHLDRCVESCERQDVDKQDYEVIIVNDGSADDTVFVAKNLSNKYGNIKVISQKNQGTAVARNNGLEEAEGDYVWFVDSDDYIEDGSLKRIMDKIDSHHRPDVFLIRMKILYQGSVLYGGHESAEDFETSGKEFIMSGYGPSSACILICKRAFLMLNNLKFTPSMFLEDGEFSLRCLSLSKRIAFTAQPEYVYEVNEDSKTSMKDLKSENKKIWGNVPLAKSWKQFAHTLTDTNLASYIIRRANSALAGTLVLLDELKVSGADKKYKHDFIIKMRDEDCFPLKGPYLSWKMNIYSVFLNLRAYLKYIL